MEIKKYRQSREQMDAKAEEFQLLWQNKSKKKLPEKSFKTFQAAILSFFIFLVLQ